MLFPIEIEGIFVLNDFEQQLIVCSKVASCTIIYRFQHEGLPLGVIVGIDVDHQTVFILHSLFWFKVFLVKIRIAAIDGFIVHIVNRRE